MKRCLAVPLCPRSDDAVRPAIGQQPDSSRKPQVRAYGSLHLEVIGGRAGHPGDDSVTARWSLTSILSRSRRCSAAKSSTSISTAHRATAQQSRSRRRPTGALAPAPLITLMCGSGTRFSGSSPAGWSGHNQVRWPSTPHGPSGGVRRPVPTTAPTYVTVTFKIAGHLQVSTPRPAARGSTSAPCSPTCKNVCLDVVEVTVGIAQPPSHVPAGSESPQVEPPSQLYGGGGLYPARCRPPSTCR